MKRLFTFGTLMLVLVACDIHYHDSIYSSRDRILGRYTIDEYSETYNEYTSYTIWIESSSRSHDAIWIDHFYTGNTRVRATVYYDKITIPRQVVNGYEFEGVGTVFGNEIHFHYSARDLYSNYRTDFVEGTAYRYY